MKDFTVVNCSCYKSSKLLLFLSVDTKNLMLVQLICATGNSEQPLRKYYFQPAQEKVYLSLENWSNYVDLLLQCPHPLKGKTLVTGSLGPNPYIYTDWGRNVQYNENGKPLGTNTGIAETLGQYFGFNTTIKLMRSYDYIDPVTKKWMGETGEVF